jgi:hypothetical protein
MRREKDWFRQAEADLDAAKNLLESKITNGLALQHSNPQRRESERQRSANENKEKRNK